MQFKAFLGAAITVLTFSQISALENNACPNYEDYYTLKTNSKCFHDVSIDKTTPEIIRANGYPLESHSITNPDGYILTLFRIPHLNAAKNGKEVIVLQHGLSATSDDFLGNLNNSLGFILFDAGHDVWLGNSRGSAYSNKHTRLTINDTKYWDYSLDDLSLVDQPLILEYIAAQTGQKGNIVYIGHSLGTTLPLMYSSDMPDHARSMLKFMFFLAPAAKLSNMISPVKLLAPLASNVLEIVNRRNLVTVASEGGIVRSTVNSICLSSPALMKTCMNILGLYYGPYTQMAADRAVFFLSRYPSGLSFNSFAQTANFVLDRFEKFDYGMARNLREYGRPKPPAYDVSKIQVPMFVFAAKNDWTCSLKDAKILYKNLSPQYRRGFEIISLDKFNHLDFLYGNDAVPLVYNRILAIIKANQERSFS